MKVVLATGIYPPDIGGPATYARSLAGELKERGVSVVVVTYAQMGNEQPAAGNYGNGVIGVSKSGGPIARWVRYAKALKKHAGDADVIIAFSSVSCGVPLKLARLKKPKKFLRLGGDFFWERYTDRGGMLDLGSWYEQKFHAPVNLLTRLLVRWLIGGFDHIVFSTKFQEEIYEKHYKKLPSHSVIENAMPAFDFKMKVHAKHDPFRILFMGRFVRFKNLKALLFAIRDLQSIVRVAMAFVGDGPVKPILECVVKENSLDDHVVFLPPVHGYGKRKMFMEYDLMVIPSVTEISPNVALEARAACLPVLLSSETGLSNTLLSGMIVANLSTSEKISNAIEEIVNGYDKIAENAAKKITARGWEDVADEWLILSKAQIIHKI